LSLRLGVSWWTHKQKISSQYPDLIANCITTAARVPDRLRPTRSLKQIKPNYIKNPHAAARPTAAAVPFAAP
jgi:hypothetical protein